MSGKHTGDDNNKHLINFFTSLCVYVCLWNYAFQQTIFFCFCFFFSTLRFGFTLFQRFLDLAFACVCLVGGALCEIWAYFELFIYSVHKGIKRVRCGGWSGRVNLQHISIVVYFDFTLTLSSSFLACLHDDDRLLFLFLYCVNWKDYLPI